MKVPKFLANAKMFAIFAKTLNKETLATNEQGGVILTAEEETVLVEHYGQKAVDILKKTDVQAEDNSQDLFNAAVTHATETAVKPLNAQITSLSADKTRLQGDIATLVATPEDDVKADTTIVGAGASIGGFTADMSLAHNAEYSSLVQNNGVMSATPTIDVADVSQELGKYLSQGGNNLDVHTNLMQSFTTANHLNWKRATKEYVALLAEAVTSVVQQFTKDWNPKGAAKFEPLVIPNYRHKVDYPIIPAEVGEDWLFYLYDERLTPDKMPITRFIIERILLPKIGSDIENIMCGKAKYLKNSKETKNTMNGIETQLVEAKKSLTTGMNFYKTDVNLLTAAAGKTLELLDKFVADIAPLYQTQKMPVFISREVYRKYKKDYKDKWGTGGGVEKVTFGSDRIDFSNCYLQVLDCLYGSPIVFSTPSQNFIGLRHKNPPQFISDIQKINREVRIFIEFWFGVGFLIGPAVFAIVPDNYDPSTAINETAEADSTKWLNKKDPAAPASASSEGGDGNSM